MVSMKHFTTLSRKIFLVILVINIGGLTILFFQAHRSGHTLLTTFAHERALAALDISYRQFSDIMKHGTDVQVADHSSTLESTEFRIRSVLLDSAGVVFSHSPKTSFQRMFPPLSDFHVLPDNPDILYLKDPENGRQHESILKPLFNDKACRSCHKGGHRILGYLGVEVQLDDLHEIAGIHKTTNIIISILLFMGLTLVVYLSLNTLVVRRIRRLQQSMETIIQNIPSLKDGKFIESPVHVKEMTGDEVSSLLHSFHHLVIELNAAQQEIHELHSNEMKRLDQLATTGEMAASIAHEIRNPLAGVSAALQIIERKWPAGDPQIALFPEIQTQLARINSAIKDLLSYAREKTPQMVEVSLHSLLDRSISMLEPVAYEHSILIQKQFHAEFDLVLVDAAMIQQVIWNLGMNAIQSIPKERSGNVIFSSHNEGSALILSVEDNGTGIPTEIVNKIFKPFYTTKHAGTGLGLAICRKILSLHGAEISVESVEDEGTVVRIKCRTWSGSSVHEAA
jgi:signal transduction histidine kinase